MPHWMETYMYKQQSNEHLYFESHCTGKYIIVVENILLVKFEIYYCNAKNWMQVQIC